MGRPSKFSQALAEKICARIADRESLRSICRDEDMPAKSTVLSWLADEDKAAFRARYALAREIMADSFVDEMVEIADNSSDDWIEKKNASWSASATRQPAPVRSTASAWRRPRPPNRPPETHWKRDPIL
ncbi:hypothetical protein NXC14_CH01163 [Rhizobium sp. NXC14]|nr:hypothetical protein NXC14_CH01163 [Rhizobium sp. NXC14]